MLSDSVVYCEAEEAIDLTKFPDTGATVPAGSEEAEATETMKHFIANVPRYRCKSPPSPRPRRS